MERTSSRLKAGAAMYKQTYMAATAEESKKLIPIEYPNKVTKSFFVGIKKSQTKCDAIIKEVTFFRKVDGYKNINNKKYRIYSAVQTKEKEILIPFFATSAFFRSLPNHPNPTLAENALAIVACFDDPFLYPLYAQQKFLELVHEARIKEIRSNADETAKTDAALVEKLQSESANNTLLIQEYEKQWDVSLEKQFRDISKFVDYGFLSHKRLKTVLSFGLYRPNNIAKGSSLKAYRKQLKLDEIGGLLYQAILDHHWYSDELCRQRHAQERNLAKQKYDFDQEQAQYAFDCANLGERLKDPKPNEDIAPVEFPYDKAEYEFELPENLVEEQEGIDFLPFEDPSFFQYEGLSVVGIALIQNLDERTYCIGISFDLGLSMHKIFDKNGSFVEQGLCLQLRKAGGLSHFRLAVKPCYSKEELYDSYCRLHKAYHARYITL